jgi:hypothetical protein
VLPVIALPPEPDTGLPATESGRSRRTATARAGATTARVRLPPFRPVLHRGRAVFQRPGIIRARQRLARWRAQRRIFAELLAQQEGAGYRVSPEVWRRLKQDAGRRAMSLVAPQP